MKYFLFIILIILSSFSFLLSQLISSDNSSKRDEIADYLSPMFESSLPFSKEFYLINSVNENEYIVDSGDIFLLKIDVPGPSVTVYQSQVTPDGHVFFPNESALYVRDMALKDARTEIKKSLEKSNNNAKIEVFLFQLHPITVTVLGSVLTEGKQQLLSNSRLFDAVQTAIKPDRNISKKEIDQSVETNIVNMSDDKSETEIENLGEKSSLRNIRILRDNKNYRYDLLRFKMLGDLKNNPYLMNEDVIIIPWKAKENNTISVDGAVGNPLQFEYATGDNLGNIIEIAGGLLPNADSSIIELYRFTNERESIEKIQLDYQKDYNFAIKPDDRIYIRFKSQYHIKYQVEILGEVKYPGVYAIQDREVLLSEIIEKAGGFTNKAYLAGAKVLRYKFLLEDRELDRLQKMTVDEMSNIEKSYMRLRSREDLRLVAVDFEKLFLQKETVEDVILRDRDIVIIPEVKNIVFVSGGILYPGNVTYNEKWNYEDYIQSAGGFNKRAKKRNIKIIKSKTGNWIDANKNVLIEEGDIIFVPESEEMDWYQLIKDGLTIATQLATIILVINNVK